MFLGDSKCKPISYFNKSCDGNFCNDGGLCTPKEEWVQKNCLLPLQQNKKIPKECICENSDKKSAIINIFIHNDTSDVLKLSKVCGDCDIACFSGSGVSYRKSDCELCGASAASYGKAVVFYPPKNNRLPENINPKTAVFIRTYSGRQGGPECDCDLRFWTNLRYEIANDPSSYVRINTYRSREGDCKGCEPIHHYVPLNSKTTNVSQVGSLKVEGTIVGGATYVVKITGGNTNNNDCTNICNTGFLCYEGQCIPKIPCNSSTGCNLDHYCGPNDFCIPGCTQTSYNCKPGTTCVNGTCSSSSNGGQSRRRMELIVVFGIVFFIIIVMGIIYFIYARNE